MNAVVGIIMLIIVFTGVFYMNKAGFFEPITGVLDNITTGFQQSYSGAVSSSSPYFHQVRIGFVMLGAGSSTLSEVDLSAKPKRGGFSITGWSLKTDKGVFTIPPVKNRYSASTPNAAPEDIFVREGDRISIYSYHDKLPSNARDERTTQSEYHLWFKDMLSAPHDTIILRDEDKNEVDRYIY